MKENRRNDFGFYLTVATRFLILGASTILSCLLISVGMYQYRQSMKLTNEVNRKMSGLVSTIREEDVMFYDGVQMTGVEIINFYRRFCMGGDAMDGIRVFIEKKGTQSEIEMQKDLDRLMDHSDDLYCITDDLYQCRIYKNRNGIIEKIIFSDIL